MTEKKKKRWKEVITSTDLTHNSRKAYKTIKNLSNDPTASHVHVWPTPTKSHTSYSSMDEASCRATARTMHVLTTEATWALV